MKTMKTIIIIAVVIIILFLSFYAYYGGFKNIKTRIEEQGGETLVFEKIQGDYRQSGKVMDSIYYKLLNQEKIETYKGFGIYYDNPQKVEKSKLRSEAGCILENQDEGKVDELNGQYNIKTFPKKQYMIAEFPYKGKLSVMFSMMKVYPALNKYAEENGYQKDTPVMEIYDVPNNKIIYRKEIQ
jgi:effector-binding domain-containing protein